MVATYLTSLVIVDIGEVYSFGTSRAQLNGVSAIYDMINDITTTRFCLGVFIFVFCLDQESTTSIQFCGLHTLLQYGSVLGSDP